MAPAEFQLISDENLLTVECTNNLVEVTKMFQYASNNSIFDKEPYSIFNNWLLENSSKLTGFLDNKSTDDSIPEGDRSEFFANLNFSYVFEVAFKKRFKKGF